jgi:hypothetical protein
LQAATFTLELYVLRFTAEYRVLEDAVACANLCKAFDNCVRCNLAMVADLGLTSAVE